MTIKQAKLIVAASFICCKNRVRPGQIFAGMMPVCAMRWNGRFYTRLDGFVLFEVGRTGQRDLNACQRLVVTCDEVSRPILTTVLSLSMMTAALRSCNNIGRAHFCTPSTNATLVVRLLLENKN